MVILIVWWVRGALKSTREATVQRHRLCKTKTYSQLHSMSPLHPHFTITIIKAYFSSSSFNPVHHVCLTKTKLQGIMKGKKTVWRTQQASEPDPFMTGMLELTDWELITTMIETVGWRHWFSGHKSEQTSGDSEGQGSLVCYSPWGCKELDTTEQLELNTCGFLFYNSDFKNKL